VRLFIAIDLSTTLRERLSDQIDQLTRLLGSEAIRWVSPSNIHLTLKFLGETPENQVERIKSTLENLVPQFSTFEMRIGYFGCFPNPRKPRVFWIGVHEESGILVQLHRAIEIDLEKFGFKKEGRPFSAHLTLGRLRKNASSATLRKLAQQLETVQVGELGIEAVKEVCLFRSVLHPSGAIYTQLGVFKLREAG
jgi:2'-5' RNA ligase